MAVMLVFLTGCWDRREINDVAFVMASAIDKEKDQYRATLQIPLIGQLGGTGSKGGGGGQAGQKSYFTLSDTGKTIREINNRQQGKNSRTQNFAHRRVVLLGEELSKEGIEPIMDIFGRLPANRLSSYMLVTKGPAVDVLTAEAPVEQFPSEMMRELAIMNMNQPRSVKSVLNIMLSEGIDLALPYIEKGKGKSDPTLKVGGLAIFKKNKLQKLVSGDKARDLMIAMGEAKRPEFLLKQENDYIVVQVYQYDITINPVVQGNNITMKVNIRGMATISDNQSTFRLSEEKNLRELEKRLQKQMKKEIEASISSVQKEQKADILGFGKIIYNRKPADWKRIRSDWDKLYPDVKVIVHPDVIIENIGAVISPLGRKEGKIND